MKTKSQRISLVRDLAARKEAQALDHLRQARQALDRQIKQLTDLQSYQQQYMESMKQGLKGRVDIQKIQIYQTFVSQIRSAIEQQESVVQRAEQLFTRSSGVWQRCHQKRKAYQDLVDRYQTEELNLAERQLEKRIEDDFSTRQRFRRH